MGLHIATDGGLCKSRTAESCTGQGEVGPNTDKCTAFVGLAQQSYTLHEDRNVDLVQSHGMKIV